MTPPEHRYGDATGARGAPPIFIALVERLRDVNRTTPPASDVAIAFGCRENLLRVAVEHRLRAFERRVLQIGRVNEPNAEVFLS